jgi:conjugative relaxase-like TrwC/TraI family protein
VQSVFKELFYGYLPGTQQRIRGDRKHGQENLAVDLTLSAPKSFSMHALKDLRLYEIHMEACRKTLDEAEKRYCYQRKFIDGRQVNVKGDGFVAAAIPHWTSREMDMMLHTHMVIFNGIQGPDGKWRAFDDRQLSYAEWLGSYYRNELAKLTQQLGYRIHEVALEEGGYSFEIDGVSREEIEHFSKRSLQILEAAQAKGVARDDMVLATRKAKRISKTWQEFRDDGIQEMDELGVEFQESSRRGIRYPIGKKDAALVIESAIRHLSNRSVTFTQEDLYKYALDHMQQYELSDVDKAIVSHPELIDYGVVRNLDKFKGHFTTATALEREVRTLQEWMLGQRQAIPILEYSAAIQALDVLELSMLGQGKQPLKSGQREAVLGTLSSCNKHQIIHGLSGVGKTTALRLLKDLAHSKGIEILGFAPSIQAAKKLAGELEIETNTLQKLVKSQKFELKPNQLLIIDEGGMASAEMMDVVMAKVNAAGARVLLVGDTGQNQAIEAGSPMRSLMRNGAEVHHIREIIRQQNSIQKRAVELIADGRGLDAIALLNEHSYINTIEARSERVQAIAREYLSLSPLEQNNTLIVAGTNAEKDAIAAEIREGLKQAGLLGQSVRVSKIAGRSIKAKDAQDIANYAVGDTLQFAKRRNDSTAIAHQLFTVMSKEDAVLVISDEAGKFYRFNPMQGILDNSVKATKLRDKKFTPEQGRDFLNYEVGDYLILNSELKTTPLKKDTLYQVVAKDKSELIVSTTGGRLYRFDPKKCKDKQVFTSYEFDVVVGDSLRWTHSIPEGGQVNGATFEITAIAGQFATAITEEGKTIQIDLSQPLTVDYTLTSTSYQSQGSDRPRVFVSATNDPTSNREPFYVAISRQIKHLKIWTQDYDGLARRVVESNQQLNPLELIIGESYNVPERNNPSSGNGIGAGFGEAVDSLTLNSNWGDSKRNKEHYEGGWEALRDEGDGHIDSERSRHLVGETGERAGTIDQQQYLVDREQHLDERNDPIAEIAESVVREQLRRELSQPLAELSAKLLELKTLQQANQELRDQNTELSEERDRIAAQFNSVMAMGKASTLGRAMAEWRSLRETPIIPDAIASNNREEIAEQIKNFKAQTVVSIALQELDLVAHTLSPKESPPLARVPVERPRRVEAFWIPDYTQSDRPSEIAEHHWDEWRNSAIHPALIKARLQSIQGQQVIERLLDKKLEYMGAYDKKGNRRKVGSQQGTAEMNRLRSSYEEMADAGGWWVDAGIEPRGFAIGEVWPSDYGTFKPDAPRVDLDKTRKKRTKDPQAPVQKRKYENPMGIKQDLFERNLSFAEVPDSIAQKIFQRYGVVQTPEEREKGFWYTVWKHPEIPIYRVEGDKKDAAVTSQGRVVISGQGVNAGYRANDQYGNKLPQRVLHPQLEMFCQPGREIRYAFDADTNVNTINNVRTDMVREGELCEARGCKISVIKWKPEQGKGADDMIAQSGPLAWEKADREAIPFAFEQKIHYRRKYNQLRFQAQHEPDLLRRDLDKEIYLRAMAEGEAADGDRFLRQSDRARALKDPQEIEQYLTNLKAALPDYVQARQKLRIQRQKLIAKIEMLGNRLVGRGQDGRYADYALSITSGADGVRIKSKTGEILYSTDKAIGLVKLDKLHGELMKRAMAVPQVSREGRSTQKTRESGLEK